MIGMSAHTRILLPHRSVPAIPQTAMEEWVEKGIAPQMTIAGNPHIGIDRSLCAWPKLPYYRSGDPAKAGSFECR
jgi:hypothetical protein